MNLSVPPKIESADAGPVADRSLAYVVAAATAVQFVLAALYAKAYWELVRTGAASLIVGVLFCTASLLLYVGAIRLAASGWRGKRSLLLGGLGLAWSAYAWRIPYELAVPLVFGSLVGFMGAWVAMSNQTRIGRSTAS